MESRSATFCDLTVWQKAHSLVSEICQHTGVFPKHALYALVSQIRRAAVSIPANIAGGFKKATGPDRAEFINIAQSPAEELRYYLILSKDLGYGDSSVHSARLDEIARMLHAFAESVRRC